MQYRISSIRNQQVHIKYTLADILLLLKWKTLETKDADAHK